jgi:hypothetical protein
MNRYIIYLCLALALFQFISCEKNYIQKDDENKSEAEQSDNEGVNEDTDDYNWDSTTVVSVMLKDNSITVDTGYAFVTGNTVTIKSAATYNLSGSLTDGQIIVDTKDDGDVKLIFNSVNITCSTSSPVYISDAKKVIIGLADNTVNSVKDASSYQNLVDGEPNAAIFSKADLSIFGNGSLTVEGNYNDGISSKDGLIIKSGNITVSSIDDGIRGKDYLIVHDGNMNINAGGDGLKSDNDVNQDLGYISVYKGSFTITSGGDAIAAQTNIILSDGVFDITSGGGSSKNISAFFSAKGIKGLESVIINGVTFSINAADDALHSDNRIEIKGGSLSLSSADDGIHADVSIAISNCNVDIIKSYEGIESAGITIENSNVGIVASDDGFNATQGSRTERNDNSCLTIQSGYIYVNSSGGDALDANGNIVINDGLVIAHGPLSEPEVGMDYNGTCKITGGTVVISGISSNMTQGPSTSSSIYSVVVKFSSGLEANSIVHIQDSNGTGILTFAPVRKYQSIIFASPKLVFGETYTIYTGGSCTGIPTNGYYSDGTYSGGSIYGNFTITGIVTTVGSSSTGPGGGGPRP